MSEHANRPRIVATGHGHYAETFDPCSEDEVYDCEKEGLIRNLLSSVGENPDREGLKRTPLRVAKAMDFLTSGYHTTVDQVIKGAIFTEECKEMVVVRGIEFYSLCEHHMLPFFGHAHVAYLPNGRVVGLSKIARVVDVFARRLQVQERLTNQVADALMEALDPHGVAVVLEANHTCMMMRGVQKQNSSTVSSAMRGTFEEDPRTRAEFLGFIRT
jgi:GTP cyclohydrolase IA